MRRNNMYDPDVPYTIHILSSDDGARKIAEATHPNGQTLYFVNTLGNLELKYRVAFGNVTTYEVTEDAEPFFLLEDYLDMANEQKTLTQERRDQILERIQEKFAQAKEKRDNENRDQRI
jgi:hypothetical protein